jgi:hypothetical protein
MSKNSAKGMTAARQKLSNTRVFEKCFFTVNFSKFTALWAVMWFYASMQRANGLQLPCLIWHSKRRTGRTSRQAVLQLLDQLSLANIRVCAEMPARHWLLIWRAQRR